MLPKKQRLNLARVENREVFKTLCTTSSHFKFYCQTHPEKKFEAGVVIPVKVVRKAAHRNQLRRWVYNMLAKHSIKEEYLKIAVVCSKKPSFDFKKIEQEINSALSDLKKR